LHDLGRHDIKGFAEPVAAWSVDGVANVECRFEATRSADLTGFIGRDEQLELLLERKRQAWNGEGQVILISREAGIGKSRLTASLLGRPAAEPHIRLRYQCSAYHTNSPLYPFIQQLTQAAAFDPNDTPAMQLDKLEKVVGQGDADVAKVTPLLASLL